MFRQIDILLLICGRCIRKSLLLLVIFYQKCISIFLPPTCRFIPSCSNYAAEVLYTQPLLKSLGLITWRLLRCQPLCKAGFDPAPPPTDLLYPKKIKSTIKTGIF